MARRAETLNASSPGVLQKGGSQRPLVACAADWLLLRHLVVGRAGVRKVAAGFLFSALKELQLI